MSKFDLFIGVYLMAQIFGLVVIPVYAGKCDVTKNILPGEPDGMILIELKKLGFPGNQNRFEVSRYMVNNTIRNSDNTNKFFCGNKHYPDERKYLCLKKISGIIKIREDTDFSLLYPGYTFEISIKVRLGPNIIGLCYVTINIKNNNTRTVTSPLPISNSTTGSTTSKVTTTKISTTKQTSSTRKPSTTTSKPLTSTTKQTPPSTSTTSKPLTTMTTTTNPCADANLISLQLEQCVVTNIDLSPVMKNASIISFELEPNSVPVKVSHLVINNRNFTASSNRKTTMKIYAIMGSLKHLMKEIEAKIVKNGQVIAIGSFLPKNCSAVLVEFFIENQRISLVSDAATLLLSTFEFCTKPTCTSLYDSWINNFASCAKHQKDNPVEQFGTCFDMCNSEQSTSKPNDIPYIWPSTSSGATATVPCKEGTGKATRLCRRMNKKKSVWGNVNNRQCKPVAKRRDEDLDKLNKAPISAANASQTAQELKNLTKNNPASLPPGQLVKITDILEQLSLFAKDEKVAEEMLETVDNCMEAPDDSFLQAARTNNMSSRIVSLLSTVCEAMIESKSEFKAVKKGFALAGAKQNKTSFRGITISYQASSSSGSKANLSMVKGVTDRSTESSTSLTLPPDLLLNSQGETQAILFIAYDSGKLFQERGRARLNSKVISAEVKNNKISGLSNPIVTKFKTNNESNAEKLCAWWDFSLKGGKGGWSTSGCNMYKSENGYTTCHCNHLTNFAVLLGADAPVQGSSHQIALSIVSYVGVAISLAGVLFTFLSYTIFPKLRENLPPKILMNLCAALALLLIIYAAGVERTSPREGCQVVAFLLHYSILCVLSWSAVEGFNSYRGIVKPMKSEIPKIMRKSAVVGWGFPLIFPIIGIAAWPDKYGDRNSCVVKGLPLYATLIAPVGVVMMLNIVSIICILSALNKSSKMYSHNAIKLLHRVRIIVAFILLFSLTWLFGFLVLSNDIVAFQYIFCILNSLQGFFIFLFYCVRNENVRKSWKEKLGMTAQRPTTTSTSATTKKTDSSFDSAIYSKTDSLKSDYCLQKNGSIDSSTKIVLTNRSNVYSTP